jgi:hypothetical protein
MPKVRKTRTETREQRELGGVSYGSPDGNARSGTTNPRPVAT